MGRYEIETKLGEGGMGVVYKAVDPVLGRPVALKVGKVAQLNPGAAGVAHRNELLREARVAAQFIHPNIAITYDAGLEADLFYTALEYIDGVGLDHHTDPAHLLPRLQVLESAFNVCYALDYIHGKGYAHLDVKPSNIMITRMGETKLMDFGIAHLLGDAGNGEKKIVGSPYYMSPEQIDTEAGINHQSDIYSLGVVLYELVSGHRPFTGKDPYEVLYRITHDDPVPLGDLVPDISPELEAVVGRAMSRDPSGRFETARELADHLQPIIRGQDSKAVGEREKDKIEALRRLLFFRHFPYADLLRVVQISTWSSHERQAWILEGDQTGRSIFFLVRGTASVHTAAGRKPLRQGECLADSAIVFNAPRSVRVRAETDCLVMAINANILNQAEEGLQVKFLKEFYKNKTMQLVDANLRLIQAGHGGERA